MVNPLHCPLKQFYLPIIFSVSGREFGTALAVSQREKLLLKN